MAVSDDLNERDSDPTWVSTILEGKLADFTPKCLTDVGRIKELKIISMGIRSTTYEAIADRGRVLIKAMRRLEDDNIEPLVLEYLTRSGFKQAPQLFCSVYYGNYPYLIMTEFIDGVPVAADYVTAASKRDLNMSKRLSNEIGPIVSRLHYSLSKCRHSWCKPEPIAEDDINRWVGRLLWRASWLRTEGASRVSENEKPLIYESADALEDLATSLRPVALNMIGELKQRTHGDLHLYQIMRTESDEIFITDFEGEPYKMPGNKMEKEPTSRDLAALARSLDYAAIMGEQLRSGAPLSYVALWPPSESLEWETSSFSYLLASYRSASEDAGFLDYNRISDELSFWLVERASYESVYELVARTGYHYIPLSAILRMRDGKDPLFRLLSQGRL